MALNWMNDANMLALGNGTFHTFDSSIFGICSDQLYSIRKVLMIRATAPGRVEACFLPLSGFNTQTLLKSRHILDV